MSTELPEPVAVEENWSVEVYTSFGSEETTFETKDQAIKAWNETQPSVLKQTITTHWLQGEPLERFNQNRQEPV